MKKIFHFDSPPEPYVADAAVLCCFDYRINRAVRKFLKKQAIEKADMIIVAGGAKTLASPRNDFEQDFILEQVRMSIRLHQTKRVLVMSHSDCATYGASRISRETAPPKPLITVPNYCAPENCWSEASPKSRLNLTL